MSIILTQKLNYWGHLSIFGAEYTTKSWSFKSQKNAETLPEQLHNNFEKVPKTTFLTIKIDNNVHFQSKNVALNFNFRGHLWTTGVKYTTNQQWAFKSQNNA